MEPREPDSPASGIAIDRILPERSGFDSIASAIIVDSLQDIVQKAIEQICQKERTLLEELLAPINDHIFAMKAHHSREGPASSDSDVSLGSAPSRLRKGNSTNRRGNQSTSTRKSCFQEVRDAAHREHRKTVMSQDSHRPCRQSVMGRRKSSKLGSREPHDVEALQRTLDGELLAMAALVPSSRSFNKNPSSPTGSWSVDAHHKAHDAAGTSSMSIPSGSVSFDLVPVHKSRADCNDIDTRLETVSNGSPGTAPLEMPCGMILEQSSQSSPTNGRHSNHTNTSNQISEITASSCMFGKKGSQKSMTVEGLRSEREGQLTKMFQNQGSMLSSLDDNTVGDEYPPAHVGIGIHVLRVCGLLPWFLGCEEEENLTIASRQHAFNTALQKMVLCVAAAACGGCAMLTMCLWQKASESENCSMCLQMSLLFDAFLSLGSFIGFSIISTIQRLPWFRAHSLLFTYAHHHMFLSIWEVASRRALLYTAAFLACVLLGRARVWISDAADNPYASLSFAASTFSIILFMGLEFYTLHMCGALATMVDCFSIDFLEQQDVGMAIREWNIIQATLRKVCVAVQWVFFVLQVTALVVVTTSLMAAIQSNVLDAPALLPGILVALSVTQVFLRATIVTEKCERLTRFINSLSPSSKDIDKERQYLVDYIYNSGAGFYFFNVRLTSQMAVKIIYICGIAVFYTATRAMSVL